MLSTLKCLRWGTDFKISNSWHRCLHRWSGNAELKVLLSDHLTGSIQIMSILNYRGNSITSHFSPFWSCILCMTYAEDITRSDDRKQDVNKIWFGALWNNASTQKPNSKVCAHDDKLQQIPPGNSTKTKLSNPHMLLTHMFSMLDVYTHTKMGLIHMQTRRRVWIPIKPAWFRDWWAP